MQGCSRLYFVYTANYTKQGNLWKTAKCDIITMDLKTVTHLAYMEEERRTVRQSCVGA